MRISPELLYMHAFSEILFLRSSGCKTATFQRYTGWPKK